MTEGLSAHHPSDDPSQEDPDALDRHVKSDDELLDDDEAFAAAARLADLELAAAGELELDELEPGEDVDEFADEQAVSPLADPTPAEPTEPAEEVGFFDAGADLYALDDLTLTARPVVLDRLGPAHFRSKGFSFMGFLQTVYDHVATEVALPTPSAPAAPWIPPPAPEPEPTPEPLPDPELREPELREPDPVVAEVVAPEPLVSEVAAFEPPGPFTADPSALDPIAPPFTDVDPADRTEPIDFPVVAPVIAPPAATAPDSTAKENDASKPS